MSFTQDELDAFNTILEQKLAVHRRELELSLDQRMSMLKQDLEHYLTTGQQELLQHLPSLVPVRQNGAGDAVSQHLEPYQASVVEEVKPGDAAITEMQAEIAWEDLMDVIDKVVADRLSTLEDTVQSMFMNIEHTLLDQLHSLRSDLMRGRQGSINAPTTDGAALQDVFTSFEQLEHLIEALQVTITANHTLLSSRLYLHQHQPSERAHPALQPPQEKDVQDEDEV